MLGSGEEGSGVLVGEVLPGLSGDLAAIESGRRMLPDCGLCFHDSVPERPNAAALATGFLGSVSSSVMGAGELVKRCSESSRAVSCCCGGLMMGVGVLAAFSCTSRGVPAAERSDCGVVGLSGEMERARSRSKYISFHYPSSIIHAATLQVAATIITTTTKTQTNTPALRASLSLRP